LSFHVYAPKLSPIKSVFFYAEIDADLFALAAYKSLSSESKSSSEAAGGVGEVGGGEIGAGAGVEATGDAATGAGTEAGA
jgi:hypothetical protein